MSNVTQQAKSGFKTFMVTFVGSLLVFGAFYYLISDSSADSVDIEDSSSLMGTTSVNDANEAPVALGVADEEVKGVQDAVVAAAVSETAEKIEEVEEAVEVETPEKDSPFAKVAAGEAIGGRSAVLAGATSQTTQSTVPETGVTSITIGFFASIMLFAFFAYIVFMNPRRYALSKFEEDATEEK